jgi:galactose mutarotase-like enzyme
MNRITTSTWNDFPALTLENESLRAVIIPNLGAKIVSLFDKARQREWLVPPMRPVKQTAYGVDFVSQDMSGWDEMLPTIVACEVQGAVLPDHGEVWSIPWRVEATEGAVTLSVDGVAFPYRFTRSAALVALNCLELRYALANTGQNAFPYLWAAHPQFAADANTCILLPGEVRVVVNVIDSDPVWSQAGELVNWPQALSAAGQAWQLDRVRPANNRACRKFYALPEQPVGWAALVDEKLGCRLRLEWPPESVPYLGLWIDEGMYNSVPVAAPEPSNGYYDSLERAIANQRVAWLDPGQTATWHLRVYLEAA